MQCYHAPMFVTHRISLPHGWRLGVIVQEGDLSVHAWLLHGTGELAHEELLYARSTPELAAIALRKIALATGVSSI